MNQSLFKKTESLIRLLFIAFEVLISSFKALLYLSLFNIQTPRTFVNNELRRRAIKIMRLAGSKTTLVLAKDFNIEKGEPYIYMSNHASLLDPPLIYSLIPGTIRFISKQSLFDVPIFGQALKKAEIVSIEKRDFFEHLTHLMKSGVSIWLFPEGQRSREGNLLKFKAGGFSLAREIGAKIVPVAILGTHQLLPAKKLQLKKGVNTEIRVGCPIDSNAYKKPEQQKDLIQVVRNTINDLMV